MAENIKVKSGTIEAERAEKVQRLRAEIQAGTYRASGADTLTGMLRHPETKDWVNSAIERMVVERRRQIEQLACAGVRFAKISS